MTNFNGIAFDVNYWKVRDELWDTDNDGQSDAGLVAGRNIWHEGVWRFLQELRQTIGNNRLITCEGQHEANQQAVGVLDGIESEGLVQHNDGFRGFSRTSCVASELPRLAAWGLLLQGQTKRSCRPDFLSRDHLDSRRAS